LISRNRIYTVGLFTLLVTPFIFPSCAPVTPKQPPRILDDREIADFISMARAQDAHVRTLISAGRLKIRKDNSENDANVLMVGERTLDKIKIEITHPWGRPVVHILVDGKRVDMVSFVDKRFYFGRLGTFDPTGLFPGGFDFDQIWAFARAFPVLRAHHRVVLSKNNQIALLNSTGETVQVVDFCGPSNLPCRVFSPQQGASLFFSRFQQQEEILYARNVEFRASGVDSALGMEFKQVVFNETIPPNVFELVKPEGFQSVPLRGLNTD
jgi:hypothetical protein